MSVDTTKSAAVPSVGLLLRLKLRLLRNRLRQLVDQSPLQLLLIIVFVATIWGGLYFIFDHLLVYIRRFEEEAIIALPLIFHLFFFSMTILLAFSTAILIYGALFGRDEPGFLLTTPNPPRNVVAVLFLESLFFSSWSLVLLGLPLMAAIGQVQGLPWHFYVVFLVAFLGFVPIPGAIGLLTALAVALFLPRIAKRAAMYALLVVILGVIIWWGRLWNLFSESVSKQLVDNLLSELSYLKAALLPSSWVARAIELSIADRPMDAAFYLFVTVATAAFLSWWGHIIVAAKLLPAFARAQSAPHRPRRHTSGATSLVTRIAFFYLPRRMRFLILKDVRNFLRDPMQWSQLVILFGLLSMYLVYLPRSRTEGFPTEWQALICFLNFGAITLILSTFTSRFVFPMMSLEGQQIWLVALWPLGRSSVMWAKFCFAMTVTAGTALPVTWLSIRAVELPAGLATLQIICTLAACAGLCALAVGFGAVLPNYAEQSAGRISSGLGGTVNLIASVGLVAVSVALFGWVCWEMAQAGRLTLTSVNSKWALVALMALNLGSFAASMWIGVRKFQRQEF
ncbi:MAG TPA: hypothetical protein VNT79_19385 [Phycisphaerae bacterium]|nr:hypothetical protein [Phycisphaerae bacterium]